MVNGKTTQAGRPLLTAVMPVYNGERYLRRTLEHIVQMPEQDMELLLIDDGSSDRSAVICREYAAADARIHYVRQDNQGIAVSRNSGLDLARGEYVCFWDQDDVVLLQGYCKLLTKIRTTRACMGICSTKRMIGDQMSPFEKITEGVYSGEEVRRNLLYPLLFRGYAYPFVQGENYLYGSVWKCIFRTDFIRDRQIRFRRFVSYEDDWIFVTHALSCADKVVTSKQAGYCWRVNEESESHRGGYIPDLCGRLAELDAYVNGYLDTGIRDAEMLTAYRKVRTCEHYVELCSNAAQVRAGQDTLQAVRRESREQMENYMRQTDYKSCLSCRKYLRRNAYRRRVILFTLRYGGAPAARIAGGVYDWLEIRLGRIRWIVRMERRYKMK